MANNANKIEYFGKVLIDLTEDGVTPETLAKGVTAHDKTGTPITGTHECDEPDLQEKSVTPSTSAQTVTPDSGYDGLSKVTVAKMPTATQATPSITVSTGGLITAKSTQSAGYVAAGTKSATKQLTVQAAQTITPGTSDKTIASGRYLTGTQTIKGDANLVPGNIKAGVSIFGVTGTMPASEDLDSVLDTQETKLNQLLTILDGKAAGGGGGASLETCTVDITCSGALVTSPKVFLTDESGSVVQKTLTLQRKSTWIGTFTAVKHTICYINHQGNVTTTGEAELLSGTMVYAVNGDCTIKIET